MIYIVDTGINIEELADHSNISLLWSPDDDFTDNHDHGTGMAKAVRHIAPKSEIAIIKNCDSKGNVTIGYLKKSLMCLMMNLRPTDKVLWCYSMHTSNVFDELIPMFENAMDMATWIIPAGNHGDTTKNYFPANISLSKSNAYVIGCLNKNGKITKSSNTPANGYITGSTQPVGSSGNKSGTSVSAAYFAGMLENSQKEYLNAINEVIEIKKISLD